MQFIATSMPEIALPSKDGSLLTSVEADTLTADESAFIDVYKAVAVEKSPATDKQVDTKPAATQSQAAVPILSASAEKSAEEQHLLVDFLDRVNAYTSRQPKATAMESGHIDEVPVDSTLDVADAVFPKRSLIAEAMQQAQLDMVPKDKAVPVLPIDDEVTPPAVIAPSALTDVSDMTDAVIAAAVELRQPRRSLVTETMQTDQLDEIPMDQAVPVLPIDDEITPPSAIVPITSTDVSEMNDAVIAAAVELRQTRHSVVNETMQDAQLDNIPVDKAVPVLPIDDQTMPSASTELNDVSDMNDSLISAFERQQSGRPVVAVSSQPAQLDEPPMDSAVPNPPIEDKAMMHVVDSSNMPAQAVTAEVEATVARILPEQQQQAQQMVPILRAMLAEVAQSERSPKHDHATLTALIQETIESLTQGAEVSPKVVEQVVQSARESGLTLPSLALFDAVKDVPVQPLTPRAESQSQSIPSGASATPATAATLGNSDNPINIIKEEGQQQLAEKIRWMVASRQPFAEIRLDPPEMGSMQIRVNVSGDSTSVSILVQHAQSKEWLNDALPRLRDMLQEQGLQLTDATVSQQGQQREKSQQGNSLFSGASRSGDDSDETVVLEQVLTPQRQGGIDAYV